MAAGHDEIRAAGDGATFVDIGQHQRGAWSAQPVERFIHSLVHDAHLIAKVAPICDRRHDNFVAWSLILPSITLHLPFAHVRSRLRARAAAWRYPLCAVRSSASR